MKTFKTRHQFYLPDDLSDALDRLAAKPGNSKTAILTDALRAWIDRKAANELDERFGPRLDRQQRLLHRLETVSSRQAAILELFVRHQLTLVAHNPPFDEATRTLGLRRFNAFMDLVLRNMGSNRDSLPPAADDRGEEPVR
ncbi:ribbon-helix-helix protein, CopG family [Sphingomonas sp. ZT3P38]|uniref:ribbon-helix-helix protein, CopG family n=1 Tax=Parasphingomonas zepuensis TaxID=3096161 RepID=UPI002FC71A5D